MAKATHLAAQRPANKKVERNQCLQEANQYFARHAPRFGGTHGLGSSSKFISPSCRSFRLLAAQVLARSHNLPTFHISRHWREKHEPHKPCKASGKGGTICHSLFGSKKAMERHLKNEHPDFAKNPANGVKDQGGRCNACKKTFTRRDNYTRHMRKKHGFKTKATK